MTIVTPSKWLANLVKDSFLGEYKIEVIHNGIDLEIFRHTESDFRRRYGLENKFVILGVASVWGERKGFYHFIELSDKLNSDEIIVLVGVSERQKNKLPKNVIGITRTNNLNELVEIYSAADVFVNPSLEDTFPTTNLEALACGTPVVTFNTGGSIESIDKNCGIVVNKGNVLGLKNAIRLFKSNKFSLNHCLKRSKLYDSDAKYIEYLDVYSNI